MDLDRKENRSDTGMCNFAEGAKAQQSVCVLSRILICHQPGKPPRARCVKGRE
jgi:hypothetical protein